MRSFTAHSGCRPLRPSEVEYLRTVVREPDSEILLRGVLIAVLISSIFWLSIAALFLL
jgi:hypothetical protein